MKVKELKAEQIYVWSDGTVSAHVCYTGMTEDKYTFIPYSMKKGCYCGSPGHLTESEVEKFINPIKQKEYA